MNSQELFKQMRHVISREEYKMEIDDGLGTCCKLVCNIVHDDGYEICNSCGTVIRDRTVQFETKERKRSIYTIEKYVNFKLRKCDILIPHLEKLRLIKYVKFYRSKGIKSIAFLFNSFLGKNKKLKTGNIQKKYSEILAKNAYVSL